MNFLSCWHRTGSSKSEVTSTHFHIRKLMLRSYTFRGWEFTLLGSHAQFFRTWQCQRNLQEKEPGI
jgi:hypothetical protein